MVGILFEKTPAGFATLPHLKVCVQGMHVHRITFEFAEGEAYRYFVTRCDKSCEGKAIRETGIPFDVQVLLQRDAIKRCSAASGSVCSGGHTPGRGHSQPNSQNRQSHR